MVDFGNIEQTEQTIKVQRKARYAESKLIPLLEKSFADGLAGRPNVLRVVVAEKDSKEALAEIRGAVQVLDDAFGEPVEGGPRGVGKRVSTKALDGDKVEILFAAVPKSLRGPKGPHKPKDEDETPVAPTKSKSK